MTKIKQLYEDEGKTTPFFPRTHVDAVVDDNGNSVGSVLEGINEMLIGEKEAGLQYMRTAMAVNNKMSASNGKATASTNAYVYLNFLPCKKGDLFQFVYQLSETGLSASRTAAVYWSPVRPVVGNDVTLLFWSRTAEDTDEHTYSFTAPNDGFILVSYRKQNNGSDTTAYWTKCFLYKAYDVTSCKAFAFKGQLSATWTTNNYIDADVNSADFGTLKAPNNANGVASGFIDIDGCSWIKLSNFFTTSGGYNGVIAGSVFYDSQQQPLSAACFTQYFSAITSNKIMVKVPDGAKYLRVSAWGTDGMAATKVIEAWTTEDRVDKAIDDIADLQDDVAELMTKGEMESAEGIMVGDGETLVYSAFVKWMVVGRTYRVHIDNTVPVTESASLSSSYVQFRLISYDSEDTDTNVLTCYIGTSLRAYYDFVIPAGSVKVQFVCRCDTGCVFPYRIEDITDKQLDDTGFYYLRGMYFIKSMATSNGKFYKPSSNAAQYFTYYRPCTKGKQYRLEMVAGTFSSLSSFSVVWGFCANVPAIGGELFWARSASITAASPTRTEYFTAPADGYVILTKRIYAHSVSGSTVYEHCNCYLYEKSSFNQLGWYVHKLSTGSFTANRAIVVNDNADVAQGSVDTSFGTNNYGITAYFDVSNYSYLLLKQHHYGTGNLYNKVRCYGSAFYKDENGSKVFVGVADIAMYASTARSQYCVVTVPSDAQYVRLFGYISGYTYFFGINREEENAEPVPDIVRLNDTVTTLNKLKQMNRYRGNNQIKQLVMLHFSDIHTDEKALKRVKAYYDYYKNYIDDVIHTGDITSSFDSPSHTMTFWNNAGADKFLNLIGNHDCAYTVTEGHTVDSGGTLNEVSAADCYTKYFAPYISQWGATYAANKCYYYKDYDSAKVRLIVLDEYHYDSVQDDWLAGLLDDALTNDLHVLMATHSTLSDPFQGAETTFAKIGNWATGRSTEIAASQTVQDFIDDGGQLICWLCGHSHYDHCGFPEAFPQQFKLVVSTQSPDRASNGDVDRTEGMKQEDSFNIISIDTKYKYLRVMKVGADYDRMMRRMDCMYYNYGTRKIYHPQSVPDVTDKEDKVAVETYISGTTVVTAGKCYVVDASSADVSLTLPDVTEAQVKNIVLYITTGASTGITISAPTGGTLLYADSYPSALDASSTYEINCLWNGTSWILTAMKLKSSL